jgi:hypothetical protein
MSGVSARRCRPSLDDGTVILEFEALDLTVLLADGVKDLASETGRHAGFDPGRGGEPRIGLDEVDRLGGGVKGEEGDGLAVTADEEFHQGGHGVVESFG